MKIIFKCPKQIKIVMCRMCVLNVLVLCCPPPPHDIKGTFTNYCERVRSAHPIVATFYFITHPTIARFPVKPSPTDNYMPTEILINIFTKLSMD